ncbi:hypothetical protein Tco_1568342 [Tanacetum coccineum]
MASFDYRLNSLYVIKECSSCGALYTVDFCCSKGGLEDKILVPKSPQNYATCENPADGLYCQSCAFVRKCLNEGWYTIHDENEILNTSESSNDNTNIVSAPQEPFVFNQDPGQNSSRSPPHIDHHCCYECGDSLNDIFCQRCTCKSCGKGAHYGYNCPPQIPIISNLEPCYNQNLNEILQNLQSLQQQCLLGTCQQCGCNEYDGVCFYCTVGNGTPINFSTPYSSNDSPSFANHPPQPQYVPYSCELCGNESHYGYDCPPQVPFKAKEKRITEEQAAKARYWKIPICYDVTKTIPIAITIRFYQPKSPMTLSNEDDILTTITATESERTFKEHSETNVDSNNDSTSSDDDSPYGEDIEYVDASPPDAEIVSYRSVVEMLSENNPVPFSDFVIKSPSTFPNSFLEETNTFDNSLTESETFHFNLEEISSGSTTTHADFSLPKYDSFIFDLSINPFPPADRSDFYHEEFADELAHIISPPDLECFYFKIEPDPGDLIDLGIRENVSSMTNVNLPFEDAQSPLLAFVLWIFLAFLTYHITPPYLLFTGSEDTIFDLCIST